jgi:glycosyltransferase involved in cell wall biosynthesis
MKICFISPKAYPVIDSKVKANFGGAEVQVTLLAKELAKNKENQVSLIVADYGQQEVEIRGGVRVIKTFKWTEGFFSQIKKLLRALRKVASRVYIQRTLSLFSGFLAFLVWLRGGKFIFMLSSDVQADGRDRLYKKLGGRISLKLLFRFSALVIVQNNYQKEQFRKKIPPGKVFLLPSSGKIPLHPPQESVKKREFILWMSRITSNKQPEAFLELARKFPQEKFLMVGKAATGEKGYFKKIKGKTGGCENIEYMDHIPFEKIDDYFLQAKLFINTSGFEGFPNSFVEATKCGVPIVSLQVDPDGIINKNQLGFCCEGNRELMKQRVGDLLKDATLYYRMSSNAYQYARERHDLEKNALKLRELIEKCL